MTAKTEFKPCPFCGSTSIEYFQEYQTEFTKSFLCVKCNNCGARIVDFEKQHCLNDAINLWNTRYKEATE